MLVGVLVIVLAIVAVVGGLVAIACVGAPVVGGWSDDAAAPAILAGMGVLLVSVLAGTWRANTAARAVSDGEGAGEGRASPRA